MEKDEMLRICRQISASLIRLKRQMRELAVDVTQIRDTLTNIQKRMDILDLEEKH